jgi:putative sterol carrier protein
MKYFTLEWSEEYCKALNNNPKYEKAGETWEGDFIFISDNQGEKTYLYMDLWHGKCRSVAEASEDTEAEFIIEGLYEDWVRVAKKELDPIRGMMEGVLNLQGDMSKIMRATKAAIELVNTITMMEGIEF